MDLFVLTKQCATHVANHPPLLLPSPAAASAFSCLQAGHCVHYPSRQPLLAAPFESSNSHSPGFLAAFSTSCLSFFLNRG